MDRFIRLFQKSTENTTCQLYKEMSRLVRLYASNLLKSDVIKAAKNNLSTLNLVTEAQLANENLGLGDATWIHIAELEEEFGPKPIYTAVRNFYVGTIKMLKIFPFGDTLLKELEIINLESVSLYDIFTVVNLSKRFPN